MVAPHHDAYAPSSTYFSENYKPYLIYDWSGEQEGRVKNVSVRPCNWVEKEDMMVMRKCTVVNPLMDQARRAGLPVVLTPPQGHVATNP